MATSTSKIFGIGLSKTGTTSLARALQILGYRTKDNMGVIEYAAGELSSIDLATVDAFDALTDTPIPSFYRELDARHPGSKFILTIRDLDGWLKSCKKQFNARFAQVQTEAHKRLFIDLYGTDVFDEEGFTNGYEKFVDGARDYFQDRPQDLLIINIASGEGWEKLCPFLARPVPDIPFPKANVTQITWMNIDDLIAVARQGGLELMRRYDGGRHPTGNGDTDRRAQSGKGFFERVARLVLGGDTPQTAVRAANNAIVRGLEKLNPRIPVLSRAGDPVPHAERRQWNHLWLVDPLDGEEAFVSGTGEFSVNIALIEDGQPIYGVVYAPATDTAYYGRAGKGAYKRVRDDKPVLLSPGGDSRQPTREGAGTPGQRPQAPSAASHALSLCALSEGRAGAETTFQPSMEWQTAAAHVVLNSAGLRLREREAGSEVGYNKEDLSNRPFRVA